MEETTSPKGPSRLIYTAFEKPSRRRHPQTREWYEDLPEEPGLGHALAPGRTWDGDPWRGHKGGRREPYFYGDRGPSAACGRQVLVLVPILFNVADPDACPKCVDWLTTPASRRPRGFSETCGVTIRFQEYPEDDELSVYVCSHRFAHQGPHRASSGATWETGPETFTPAPDGFV